MPLPAAPTVNVETESPKDDVGDSKNLFAVHEWEEPHPGQRLSYSMETTARWVAGLHHATGVFGGGMAAKSYGPRGIRTERPGMVRRAIRARSKNPTPKPIMTPVSEMTGGPLPARRRFLAPQANVLPAKPEARAGDYATGVFETDTDTETEVGTRPSIDRGDADELEGKRTQPTLGSLCFTDFSGLLGNETVPEDDNDSLATVVDGEAYCPAAPHGDLYGWEEELERKVALGIVAADSSHPCGCDDFQYRRVNGRKRKLLHRVLSLGAPRESLTALQPSNER